MPSLQPQFSPEHLAAVKRYRKLEDLLPSHWSESRVSANGLRHHYYRTGGEKPQLVPARMASRRAPSAGWPWRKCWSRITISF